MKLNRSGFRAQPEETSGKGNGTVAVVSGPEAERKRTTESEAVMYKRLAGIEVFDIELQTEDPWEVIRACQRLEPRFAGLKLQNIQAPECFQIEDALRASMGIPVFHDDDADTATLSGAALLNAAQLAGKPLERVRVVFDSVGATAITCARHFIRLGVHRENITMCDSAGVVSLGRRGVTHRHMALFAFKTNAISLTEALLGADVLIALSPANCINEAMLAGMNFSPIVFALADTNPALAYETALNTRPGTLIFTRRSGLPNQLTNMLGAPAIFRGALDVGAVTINDEMMIAASVALASLAKEDVPESVWRIYGDGRFAFGRDYMIPVPFDSRRVIRQAVAVASAAMKTGVARHVLDLEKYRKRLEWNLDSLSGTDARDDPQNGTLGAKSRGRAQESVAVGPGVEGPGVCHTQTMRAQIDNVMCKPEILSCDSR